MREEILNDDQVVLYPFTRRHLTDEYVGWLNDPIVTQFSEQRHKKHNLESCKKYLDSLRKNHGLIWAIHSNDLHIGNISATFDINNYLVDVGILIGKSECYGRGVGFKAWQLIVNYLRRAYPDYKITAGCMENNFAMLRIMEKSGMVDDGYRKDHFLFDGRRVGLLYKALNHSK
jgi:RimJ/RimL family protein N-acetyltransferase